MLHEVITRRLKRALAESAFPDLLVIDGGKGQLHAALAAAHDLGVPTAPVAGNPGLPFVEMAGLAKSRLMDYGTARVVRGSRPSTSGPLRGPYAQDERKGAAGGRGGEHERTGAAGGPGAEGERAAALADAAEARGRGFVSELERTPERVFLPGRKDAVVLRQNSAEMYLLTRLRDEAHRFAITFHRKLRRSRNFQSVLEDIPGIGAGRRKALLRALGSLRRIREAPVEELARVEGFGPRAAQAVWDFFHAAGAAQAAAAPAEAARSPAAEGAPPAADAAPGLEVSEAEIDAALAEEAAGDVG